MLLGRKVMKCRLLPLIARSAAKKSPALAVGVCAPVEHRYRLRMMSPVHGVPTLESAPVVGVGPPGMKAPDAAGTPRF